MSLSDYQNVIENPFEIRPIDFQKTARLLNLVKNSINPQQVAVGAAAVSVAVTFTVAFAAAPTCVHVTPEWNAATWVTAITATGCTAHFSAAPGGAGSTCMVTAIA